MPDAEFVPIPHFPASLTRAGSLHSLIVAASEVAAEKFLDYFTTQIRNRNTREPYARAMGQFLGWCEEKGLSLTTILRNTSPPTLISWLSLRPL